MTAHLVKIVSHSIHTSQLQYTLLSIEFTNMNFSRSTPPISSTMSQNYFKGGSTCFELHTWNSDISFVRSVRIEGNDYVCWVINIRNWWDESELTRYCKSLVLLTDDNNVTRHGKINHYNNIMTVYLLNNVSQERHKPN